ncbi:MAG TPA: helix-turn-helix domain-containing protein, partial [Microlunatus sp.]|nr:helix-turn-helix domain-containing protein [Microlunatus sp.]
MTTEQVPTGGVQSLARGLQVLRTLIDEGSPLTGTEIARRFGLHQSSISRVLATLAELGYVRKDASGKFVPDYGILTFAPAIPQFPLVVKPRATIEQIAAEPKPPGRGLSARAAAEEVRKSIKPPAQTGSVARQRGKHGAAEVAAVAPAEERAGRESLEASARLGGPKPAAAARRAARARLAALPPDGAQGASAQTPNARFL